MIPPLAILPIRAAKAFRDRFELGGESLKRAPRGYDPDHPLVEDLKRKDFVAFTRVSEEEACAPGFLTRFIRDCRRRYPLHRYERLAPLMHRLRITKDEIDWALRQSPQHTCLA